METKRGEERLGKLTDPGRCGHVMVDVLFFKHFSLQLHPTFSVSFVRNCPSHRRLCLPFPQPTQPRPAGKPLRSPSCDFLEPSHAFRKPQAVSEEWGTRVAHPRSKDCGRWTTSAAPASHCVLAYDAVCHQSHLSFFVGSSLSLPLPSVPSIPSSFTVPFTPYGLNGSDPTTFPAPSGFPVITKFVM